MTHPRFSFIDDRLTVEAKVSWEESGLLVLEHFIDPSTCNRLRQIADRIVAQSTPEADPTVFSTQTHAHAASDYFATSGDKVRCFYEEGAFDHSGHLNRPKERAINKIGHALHDLEPDFEAFAFSPKIGALAKALGLTDALLLQSMFIFKQPGIGGEVGWHQDSTFLYTEPLSALGFWFALEEATVENGALWALPGGHRQGVGPRFRRVGEELVVTDKDKRGEPDLSGAIPLEVEAGTLILLHGELPHFSSINRSSRSRYACTLHTISAASHYPEDNWLQRKTSAPLRYLHNGEPQ